MKIKQPSGRYLWADALEAAAGKEVQITINYGCGSMTGSKRGRRNQESKFVPARYVYKDGTEGMVAAGRGFLAKVYLYSGECTAPMLPMLLF
jgi:hypothetical protein